MKKLTQEEWNDRLRALAEAERIFVHSGITNNITIAFKMYQEILAEKDRPAVLNSVEQEAYKGPSWASATITIPVDIDLEKPACPDCGKALSLREAKPDEIQEGFRSVWFCQECRYEGMSEKSVMRWIRELPEKGQEEVSVESRIEKEDVPRG